MVKTYAAYIRVSTDRQTGGRDTQRYAIENHFRQKGISDYKIYEDFGVSGTRASRPGLNQLMVDIENGSIKYLCVYSFSRYARNTRHLLESMEKFQLLKVDFVSLSENIDTSTAMGKAMFTIISAIATLERDILAERVRSGISRARAEGKQIGRKQHINIALVKELRAKKLTYKKIAELLNCSEASVCRIVNLQE